MLDIESEERNISFCIRFPDASYVFVLDKEAICEEWFQKGTFLEFHFIGFPTFVCGAVYCL
jgi:hypothetical protein